MHGSLNKLEKAFVHSWLLTCDIVVLTETKTKGMISVPGFICIGNDGGVGVIVKRHLHADISWIDTAIQDQTWFKFKSVPDVIFGGLYIRPRDSSYYTPVTLASITQKCESGDRCIIIGDFNSRCGTGVERLV